MTGIAHALNISADISVASLNHHLILSVLQSSHNKLYARRGYKQVFYKIIRLGVALKKLCCFPTPWVRTFVLNLVLDSSNSHSEREIDAFSVERQNIFEIFYQFKGTSFPVYAL